MKRISTLLIFVIAISACKKDTPKKKTLAGDLVGKKYKSYSSYYPGITFLEFKPYNYVEYYETDDNGTITMQKSVKKWEPIAKEANKIRLWLYADGEPLTGVLKGDTLIADYQNVRFIKFLLVKL